MKWVCGLAGAAGLAVFVAGQSAAPASKATVSLYTSTCAACHGPDGHAAVPAGKTLHARDFHSAEVQGESDDTLVAIVTSGKNKMPAYSTKLNAQQIKDLVAYAKQLGAK